MKLTKSKYNYILIVINILFLAIVWLINFDKEDISLFKIIFSIFIVINLIRCIYKK